MDYESFRTWLAETVENASADRRHAFALDTVGRLLNAPMFAEIDRATELSEIGWTAFDTARRDVFVAPPHKLKEHLAVVDANVLTEGSMDRCLLDMLMTIEYWAAYLENGSSRNLVALACIAVEQIDWHVSASLDDFLASPEMRVERNRISALLTD